MRKHQRDQILDLISTLHSAHEEINFYIDTNNYSLAKSILADCQECAINIGTSIETIEDEQLEVIKYIEDYCEYLYDVNNSLESLTSVDTNKKHELLTFYLKKIELYIRNEIKVKLEIVFLPYKASMWDSLESIWLAATNDEKCSCYVIPIPYYDKTEDRKFGKMHYEGEEYPEYVAITPYMEYDFKARKPDVIYIHSPYDQFNKVTSVHPAFYTSELKKYTNMLVYVPYFVCLEDIPEYLCENIGMINADHVIVQSEIVKSTYLRVYKRLLKSKQFKLEEADNKFLALGSPKIDKVISSLANKPKIPEEWKNIIGRKKVILYNTHMNPLINNGDLAINKINFVFSLFKDREDVILLWRPHPLSSETTASMRPQLLQQYYEIEKRFKEEKIGIYDDSADLHRAISISNAYLGDRSSLVPMYGLTGKPIMIQNINIANKLTDEMRFTIGYEDFVKDGDYIWFSDFSSNGLYKMHIESEQVDFIGQFPNEDPNQKRLYTSVIKYEDKLIFAPFLANEAAIYDISKNKFKKIAIKEPKSDTAIKYLVIGKFFEVFTYGYWAFFVPCSYPAIVRYNMETGETDYITDWINEFECEIVNNEDVFFRTGCMVDSKSFLMPFCNANAVMEFNMEKCQAKIHKVGSRDCCYSSICYDGMDYWLAPRHKGAVVKWNIKTGKFSEYNNFPTSTNPCDYSYLKIVYVNGNVLLIPQYADDFIIIDINSGAMKIANIYCEDWVKGKMKFSMSLLDNTKLYLCSANDNKLIRYDFESKETTIKYAVLPKEIKRKKLNKTSLIFKKDRNKCNHPLETLYHENLNSSIADFIELVCDKVQNINSQRAKLFSTIAVNSDGSCGKEIHQKIIKDVM